MPATMPMMIHERISTGHLLTSLFPIRLPVIPLPFRPLVCGYDACDGIAVEPLAITGGLDL
jgi:hypothetical protein